MSIVSNINKLNTNIINTKTNLKNNLSEKGVTAADSDTLSVMIDKVNDIPSGINWSDTGYDGEPKLIADEHAEAAKWYSEWDPANTVLDKTFTSKYPNVSVFPLIDTSNVTSMENAFERSKIIYIPQINTSKVTNMDNMFANCELLTSIPPLDTSKVTTMYYSFYRCLLVKEIPPIDTSNVTYMSGTFASCVLITSIPPLDTSKVIKMDSMFMNCKLLTSIPPLDTSKVTIMSFMFQGCASLTKTPIIDVSSCTSMFAMFDNCNSLIELWFKGQPKSNLDTSYMFDYVTTKGTFYYDHRYSYSKIIAVLPSGWSKIAWNYDTNSPA